ncbi:Aste57867_10682 [Aphanomyces stellatus]|uniref:Aste57867_10682 protein n=1 Tax=Aphanomyces stellatus TaxID=120398 RepID=A0A485KRF7_9STRA|nr:hypothetical protein As57867_010642 [Aphanomyces stellatus]VFT87554.1 Aste57867_10682 [Aphanomyces stellatus]
MAARDDDVLKLTTRVSESVCDYIGVELDGAMERTKLVDKVMLAIHTKYDAMIAESKSVVQFSARMKESEAMFHDRMLAIDEVDEELTELEDMIQQLELYAGRIYDKFTMATTPFPTRYVFFCVLLALLRPVPLLRNSLIALHTHRFSCTERLLGTHFSAQRRHLTRTPRATGNGRTILSYTYMNSCKSYAKPYTVHEPDICAFGCMAAAVLQSRDLLTAILLFQHGLHGSLTPLLSLTPPTIDDLESLDTNTLDDIDAVLAPWYTNHALSRMDALYFSHHVCGLVLLHAVYTNRVSVVVSLTRHQHGEEDDDAGTGDAWRGLLLMDLAAYRGHLLIVKLLHDLGHDGCTSEAMDWAATHGHFDVVEFLHMHRKEGCTSYAMSGAAANGHAHIVEFLHVHRHEGCFPWALDAAATAGHESIVRFLHVHRDDGASPAAMNGAAVNGHASIVVFLHEQRKEGCTMQAMNGAAERGHLAIVQYLHAHRSEGCSKHAMNGAAARGHLDVVQWLHEHRSEGCSMDAMDRAAANGHVHVLAWLHTHRVEGCSALALNNAAQHGHLDVVQWLVVNRTEGCVEWALRGAKTHGQIHVAAWLAQHGGKDATEEK